MTKSKDHAGSGIDQPDPKSLLERIGDGVKSALPKKPKPEPLGQARRGMIVPPAD